MENSPTSKHPIDRKFYLTAAMGLFALVLLCWVLAFTLPKTGEIDNLIGGSVILGAFAVLLWLAHRWVKEIEVRDDSVVFHPVGFAIPYAKIKSVDIQKDANGNVFGVVIKSHESTYRWIPLSLLWFGTDIRISLFGAKATPLLTDLAEKHAVFRER